MADYENFENATTFLGSFKSGGENPLIRAHDVEFADGTRLDDINLDSSIKDVYYHVRVDYYIYDDFGEVSKHIQASFSIIANDTSYYWGTKTGIQPAHDIIAASTIVQSATGTPTVNYGIYFPCVVRTSSSSEYQGEIVSFGGSVSISKDYFMIDFVSVPSSSAMGSTREHYAWKLTDANTAVTTTICRRNLH